VLSLLKILQAGLLMYGLFVLQEQQSLQEELMHLLDQP
jgi:hypothetical protein